MIDRLRARPEWKFFVAVGRADRRLAAVWWALLVLRGALPSAFAIAVGVLVGAVEQGGDVGGPLVAVGILFVAAQVLAPLHGQIGINLGDRLSSWLNDQLLRSAVAPQGMGHLERGDLIDDLTLARDFDLGITGPPMAIAMGFIATGLTDMVAGLAAAVVLGAYHWWAPLVLAPAWLSTHWLLRESSIWRGRNTTAVLEAQRHADYTYRLAVDAPAAKELRLFGLAGWTVDRFAARRRQLVDLRWEATKLRQQPVRWALVLVLAANTLVFWSLARDAASGTLALGRLVTFAQVAIGTSLLAFGGLNWALTMTAAPAVDAVLRVGPAMAAAGTLPNGRRPADGLPARTITFRNVTFTYASGSTPVLDSLDLTIPAGTSLAIVGRNGAGKTTLAKLLCRLYDPQAGAIEIDGVDLRDLDVVAWRRRVAAVFQDYIRWERSLRDNVAPCGAPDPVITRALAEAGADGLAPLETVLATGYAGGVELSGGQWQRVALARALAAVHQGAGVVILDEPTAQLDVRGEAEIFGRLLAATRACTTILVSHRFSTVRQADRICVLEHGKVVELGSHDELMALGGRYRAMFDLQAARFAAGAIEEGEEVLDAIAPR